MKKILVCDDDQGILEIFKIILEDSGYDVKVLNTSKAIQKRIQEYGPDLILLDIWMPGMDGKEMTKILKKDTKTAKIPIIIVSALNETEKIANAIGADDFLAKPFDMEELVAKVKRYTS